MKSYKKKKKNLNEIRIGIVSSSCPADYVKRISLLKVGYFDIYQTNNNYRWPFLKRSHNANCTRSVQKVSVH